MAGDGSCIGLGGGGMALDLGKTKYRLVVITEKKKQYNIRNFVTSLGWEENENEISNSVTSFMNRLVTVQIPLELLRHTAI